MGWWEMEIIGIRNRSRSVGDTKEGNIRELYNTLDLISPIDVNVGVF